MLLAVAVSAAIGEEAAAAQARGRSAVRRDAPRSEPVRQAGRAERSRGTDEQGRVRSPRGGFSAGDRQVNRAEPREAAPRPADRGSLGERAAAPPRAPSVRPEPQREPAPRAVERARGTDDEGRMRAVPRASTRPPTTITRTEPANVAPPAVSVNSSASAEEEQRRAQPRGSRPRGDNPAVGRALPRDGRSTVDGWYGGRDRRGSRGIFVSRGRTYRTYNTYYYYYPRRWYPYGYGAFGGLGYFYYDPYTWYAYDPYWSRPFAYSGGYYRHHYGSYYDTGELRLQVIPRHAEVYVDGYFAGHVDDFDGIFQGLRLEEGPYRIEIVAPGYEPLEFDIRILPGRKVTYRGELRPRP